MPAIDADEAVTTEVPDGAGATRTRDVRFGVTAAIAVALAVLAIAMTIIAVRDRRTTDDSGDRTEISTTAARVAEAVSSMDGSGAAAPSATISELGTSPVVAQYDEISKKIQALMVQVKLKSIRGTVKEVYVGNIDRAESRVIVRLDLVYVGDNTRVIPDQYLEMTLAKLDGVWKVDNVDVLNVALSGGAPASAPPVTGSSTTVPAPSSSS